MNSMRLIGRSALQHLGTVFVVAAIFAMPSAAFGQTTDTTALTQGAPTLPAEVQRALDVGNLTGLGDSVLDQVYTLDHFVPTSETVRIHLRESFTLRSWVRLPHRAILMIPGTVVNGEFFNIPVDGYQGRDLMARRGFFAFSVDQEGSGQSTFPNSGFTPTYNVQTATLRTVAQYIQIIRTVPRVDVLGESDGGGLATQLCASADRIRSCTVASAYYRTGTAFFNSVFGNPQFRAMIMNAPNGYLTTTPDMYFNILVASPPDVAAWTRATQPGRYAAGLLLQDLNLPSYDPTHAAVPGLIIRGELDQNFPLSDTMELASLYGSAVGAGPARIAIIQGGSDAVRVDMPPRNLEYWSSLTQFIDP
jgi:pimeloyl-ACP methyl ester carboxylesterase